MRLNLMPPAGRLCKFLFTSAFLLAITLQLNAQKRNTDSANYITLKASGNYNKGKFYKIFFGEHYRKEWNTPVTAKIVSLDTLRGGLAPYQTGGSRQTKSIRVTDKNRREYAFRSVDKSFGGALPPITQGTFVANLANDQVTISHPYSALIVAPLAEAAGIFHANPELVYVPKQPALGIFNDSTGNILYTLEQRPDEDWRTAPNFGNSENIVGTEKMLEKILKDNDNSVDQQAFARARLFDMWVGDWGRHDDQWRWATFKKGKKTTYVPVPRDRDNTFTKLDGIVLKALIPAVKAYHMQSFDYKIKHVNSFNYPARNLDHHLLNEVTKEEWAGIAADLQKRLTDDEIDRAVKKFPTEVYSISGPDIAKKLKARRALLSSWALTYYNFLSTDVEVTGTTDEEKFTVNRLSDTATEVSIYKINNEGNAKSAPYYQRVFKTNETNEVRLYGIGGNDVYEVTGDVKKSVKVRLIGGTDKDTYTDNSHVSGPSKKTKIYDNPGNEMLKTTKETNTYISKDSSINRYDYEYFKYNRQGIVPLIFYNNDDRVFAGLGYIKRKQKWRKDPFANTQYIDGKYSFSQKAVSATYYNIFIDLFGKWNFRTYINYDEIRWTNFYGIGNETELTTKDRDFNRVRSEEFITRVNTDRVIDNRHRFTFGANYQTYRIVNDTARYLIKSSVTSPAMNGHESFGALEAGYVYQNINDSVLPTKGIGFSAYGTYVDNLAKSTNDFFRYGAETNIYIPLSRKFSVMLRGGGAAITGDPEFYQLPRVGGSENLRGHQRDRYYGRTMAFNQNEIRYITNFRSVVFNGKIGIFGLYDQARVWAKGEDSNKWHPAYGGGIIVSPFNKLSISAAYAVSEEDSNIHFRLMRPL